MFHVSFYHIFLKKRFSFDVSCIYSLGSYVRFCTINYDQRWLTYKLSAIVDLTVTYFHVD